MKTLHLYYFSGTGATELVARAFGRGMAALGYAVELYPVETFVRGERALPDARPDLVGFGSPVMGYGTPRIVRDFLRSLPAVEGLPAFVFRSAGGVAPINARASAPLLRELRRKGYEPFYERAFAVASNWIAPHAPEVVRRLRLATERKVEAACAELAAGTPRLARVAPAQALALDLLRAVSVPGLRLAGRDLRATEACVRCGACAARCPTANIDLAGGAPRFGSRCTLCLRCVYGCPKKAIEFRRFGFIPIPGGFDLQDGLRRAELPGQEPPARIPPFLEGYERELAR